MILYSYKSDTKEYEGELEASIDPLETEIQGKTVYAFPPYTTEIAPFTPKSGNTVIFNENKREWEEVEDHRGLEVWTKEGTPYYVDFLGPIPQEYLLEKPVSLKELKEIKVEEVNSQYREEYLKRVKVENVNVNIEDSLEIKNKLLCFGEFGTFTVTVNNIPYTFTKEEAEDIIKFLYIRSMLLSERRTEILKVITSLKSKEKIAEFKIDFKVNEKEFQKLAKEELKKRFNK